MSSLDSQSYATTEEPDILIGHYVGLVDVDDVRRLVDFQRAFCKDKANIFLIADLHRMKEITPAARRVSAEPVDDTTRVQGIAVVGANFHFRVIGTMVFRAAQLLNRTNRFPVRFFESYAPARVWFDELRRSLT